MPKTSVLSEILKLDEALATKRIKLGRGASVRMHEGVFPKLPEWSQSDSLLVFIRPAFWIDQLLSLSLTTTWMSKNPPSLRAAVRGRASEA